MYGDFVFMSGDSLAPQAVKQAINNVKNHTGSFPYWFPFIFSGICLIMLIIRELLFFI